MELSQSPQISSDEKTKGFDLSAGKTWIYPENYPIRDYQFNIVQASLYKNTLVCLPTGKYFLRILHSNKNVYFKFIFFCSFFIFV